MFRTSFSLGLKRFFSSSEGAAAAEFATLLPIILSFVFALYEFGKVYWVQNQIQFAAEETARWAMANNPACTTGGLQTYFNSALSPLSPGDVTWWAPTQPTTTSNGITETYCQIKATYAISILKLFSIPASSFTLVGQAQYPT